LHNIALTYILDFSYVKNTVTLASKIFTFTFNVFDPNQGGAAVVFPTSGESDLDIEKINAEL